MQTYTDPGKRNISVDAAFVICEKLARSHYENFSLGSRLLPADLRKHFYSIYAFCRAVDDLGDEARGDRNSLLNNWEQQLLDCYGGKPGHPYFIALESTITKFDIPIELFLKLIEANKRDQTINRYPDFESLLDYCKYSANPVGRIVLHLFGHREPELQRLSDHTCTALQLTNFWQDVARDYAIGRIYIPKSTMKKFGTCEAEIATGKASRAFREAIKYEVDRTRDKFEAGMPLIELVSQPAKLDIALFTAGGLAVLEMIERQNFDVLAKRPFLSKWKKAVLFTNAYIRSKLGLELVPSNLAT